MTFKVKQDDYWSITLELVDYDDVFNRQSSKIPTIIDYDQLSDNKFFKKKEKEKRAGTPMNIINTISETSQKEKELTNRSIYTKCSSDLLSNMPMCECQATYGEFNRNVKCNICGTPVKSQIDEELHSLIWIQAPEGVEALINPTVWSMLNKRFSRGSFEIIRWICDTTYAPLVKAPPVLDAVRASGIPRGYNNFVRNFDAIMEIMFELKAFKLRKDEVDPLKKLLTDYRHCVFSKYLPVPNKVLLVVEENNLGTFVDPTIIGALDAIRMMVGIDSEMNNHSVRTKENRTVKAISAMADFYADMAKDILASKQGVFRRHVYGTRSHFSFRAVISSKTDAHHYEQIDVPWGAATSVFRLHLINKLFRRGFNPSQAISYLNEHAQKYSPLLDELFKELIAEAPDPRGIAATMNRNPSLARGSIQAVFIGKIKTEVNDPTVGISILCVRSLNADFDGDAMNFTLAIDEVIADYLKNLAPHKSTFGLDTPFKVTGDLSIPKPVVASIASWIDHPDGEVVDPQKLQAMEELFD